MRAARRILVDLSPAIRAGNRRFVLGFFCELVFVVPVVFAVEAARHGSP
jgi:hypothetical protein